MRMKIRKILIFLMALIFIISLTACGKKAISKDSNISLNNDIPKDGVINALLFADLKESKEMALFNGKNDEFIYQWMFMGNDIQNPKDINLLVNSSNDMIDKIKEKNHTDLVQGFIFKEKSQLESSTALSITLPKKWKCSSADIYKYNKQDENFTKVTGATVETSEKTTINFSVLDREGIFYIVGSDPKQEAIDQDEKKSDKKQEIETNSNDVNKSKGEKKEESLVLKEQLGIDTDKGKPNEDGKDKYLTDPVPEGKPKPVEWNESENKVDKSKVAGYCTLSIKCDTLLKPENRKVAISNGKGEMIPEDGVIYSTKKVKFYKNESVFDVLLREVQEQKIHMEFSMTPIYNSNYIEGINNLYEFDGGELSGWMYKVNGWFPNYGCSRYQLKEGDVIEWVYTCDLGRDVGCDWMGGNK